MLVAEDFIGQGRELERGHDGQEPPEVRRRQREGEAEKLAEPTVLEFDLHAPVMLRAASRRGNGAAASGGPSGLSVSRPGGRCYSVPNEAPGRHRSRLPGAAAG